MPQELQLIADSLAGRLQRSVAIDDPQMRLLVHTAHGAETVDRHRVQSITHKTTTKEYRDWALHSGVDMASTAVRVPANPDLEVIARVCVPIRGQGILLGYLWLLDADQTVSDIDVDLATMSADLIGRVLHQQWQLGDLHRSRDRELLRDLLSGDLAVREPAAHRLIVDGRLPDPAHLAVLTIQTHPDDPGTETAIDLALRHTMARLTSAHGIATSSGATGTFLLADRQTPPAARLQEIAEDLHTRITKALPGDITVRVGIGPVVDSPAHAYESHIRAQNALKVAARVPEFAAVAPWDALGIYRLLVQLPPERFHDTTIPDGLLRLLDTDDSGTLVDTLEVYLDEATRPTSAIEHLQIHRTSLYYRLHRIEKATGMDLGNGYDRLALHLGIKMARLSGLWPNHGS